MLNPNFFLQITKQQQKNPEYCKLPKRRRRRLHDWLALKMCLGHHEQFPFFSLPIWLVNILCTSYIYPSVLSFVLHTNVNCPTYIGWLRISCMYACTIYLRVFYRHWVNIACFNLTSSWFRTFERLRAENSSSGTFRARFKTSGRGTPRRTVSSGRSEIETPRRTVSSGRSGRRTPRRTVSTVRSGRQTQSHQVGQGE